MQGEIDFPKKGGYYKNMTTLSPHEEKSLHSFKKKLQALLGSRLLDLKLFGSRAKGQGNEFSDLDVLVVVSDWDWALKREIFDLAWECYWEWDVDLSPLVLTPKEWEELKGLERHIAADIEKYGAPL